jgi:hypothetical protein
MKSIIVNAFIVLAAAAGVIFLLKKGGEAGASKVEQISAPIGRSAADAEPIRPQTIEGRIDDFNQPVTLQQIRSWGSDIKYGFRLAVSGNPKWNRPQARVTFAYPTPAPIVLEIDYTIEQNLLEMIEADLAAKNRFDGVAVQVTTAGGAYNSSVLLKLDPLQRADDRKWLSYNLTVPTATKEIHFWIAGIPPNYSVFWANCAISLPQLRITPGPTPSPANVQPTPAAPNP